MFEPSSFRGLNRRDLFRLTAAGLAGTCTAPWFQALARHAPESPASGARQKSCILLWMIGGPPQTLTFDPKSHSAIKGINTAAPGVKISENLPKMASVMKDVTLIRGMQTADSNHGTARYLMHTGFRKGQNGVTHPVLGSVFRMSWRRRMPSCPRLYPWAVRSMAATGLATWGQNSRRSASMTRRAASRT